MVLALHSADLRLRSAASDGSSAAALARDALSIIEWNSGAGGWALLLGGHARSTGTQNNSVKSREGSC